MTTRFAGASVRRLGDGAPALSTGSKSADTETNP